MNKNILHQNKTFFFLMIYFCLLKFNTSICSILYKYIPQLEHSY
ncbi:Uncharacterized protein GY17_00003974 [Cryptosporidium hominis]|uniref:Uncharacterized protein n=1 Tax=Cryptosporidium hominis TaxID=237895 RepID=A0ABX5B7N8_CRYHO|nr:Uncharacterized protein GY17_00003974 [Cryptosporidium hominis]|eukprot:PPS91972.1 Uncharacterized protein GY17_00003974 [Cryptosporidium hominis]